MIQTSNCLLSYLYTDRLNIPGNDSFVEVETILKLQIFYNNGLLFLLLQRYIDGCKFWSSGFHPPHSIG